MGRRVGCHLEATRRLGFERVAGSHSMLRARDSFEACAGESVLAHTRQSSRRFFLRSACRPRCRDGLEECAAIPCAYAPSMLLAQAEACEMLTWPGVRLYSILLSNMQPAADTTYSYILTREPRTITPRTV